MNGKTKNAMRVGGYGMGGLGVLGLITLVINLGKVGAVMEPLVTQKADQKIEALREKLDERTRGIASDGRIREIEQTMAALARAVDTKEAKLRIEMLEVEKRFLLQLQDFQKETIGLMVAALKNQGGTP